MFSDQNAIGYIYYEIKDLYLIRLDLKHFHVQLFDSRTEVFSLGGGTSYCR